MKFECFILTFSEKIIANSLVFSLLNRSDKITVAQMEYTVHQSRIDQNVVKGLNNCMKKAGSGLLPKASA